MDNSTRRILLDKIKSSGYPGSVLDVYAAYDQGVDLVQDFMNQQMQAQGQQPQQQLQQPQQPQDQGQMQQQMQQMQQSPEPIPTQPPGVNLPTMQTPQENYVDSAGRTSIGLANIPETRSAEMINNPAKMQMGGSYQTNQEISMYEWNSGRPKQYLKGGLRTKAINRFATGGSRTCPEGYLWDDKLQDCVKLYTDFGEFKIANQAYQDSSDAYNKTKDIQNPKYYTDGNPSWYSFNGSTQEAEKFMKKNNMDLDFDGKFPGKIQPIETGYFGEGVSYPIYKKPQPVRYVEEPIRMNQKPIKKLVEYTTPATLNPASLPENIRQDMSRLQDKSLSWEDTMKKYSDKYPGMEPIYQMTNNREGVGNQKLMGFTYRDYYDQENPRKFRPKEYRFKVGGFTKMLYNKPKYKK